MALPDIQRRNATNLLEEYCAARVPASVRDKVRLNCRVRGQALEMFESRPAFLAPHEWQDMDIAKFRYVHARRVWRLCCKFSDGRWRSYQPYPEAATFEELLHEVEDDPTGIFWG